MYPESVRDAVRERVAVLLDKLMNRGAAIPNPKGARTRQRQARRKGGERAKAQSERRSSRGSGGAFFGDQ